MQAELGLAWASWLGVIGRPGPEAVNDPSLPDQVRPRPLRFLGASDPGEFEGVSLGDRAGRAGVPW